jgi:hypothetical protein
MYSLANYSGDHIKKNEMEGAYSMYGSEGRCTHVLGEKPEENGPWKI